jgi:2-oxoglutarate ferredoxin oxidoreductase subunit alpha
MVPVIYLSDGYLGNGSEPWLLPKMEELPRFQVNLHTEASGFQPYARDAETLARPWAVPGTPGLEHRIGGIEKQDITGNVSYEPENHMHMVMLRAEKVARIENDIPELEIYGEKQGRLLVLGWGSTYGSITSAVEEMQHRGFAVSSAHLRHLNPFPKNLGDVLGKFDRVLVPELNLGQLAMLLRAKYLVPAISFPKVKGKPFKISELTAKIEEVYED